MRLADKRAALLAEIPPGYSGVAHFVGIQLAGAAVIAACLAGLREPSPWEWTLLPGFALFANWFEWWVHKGPMHHLRPRLRRLYERHAQLHHVAFTHDHMALGAARELKYVLFPPFMFPLMLLLTAPVPLILGPLVSWNLALLFLIAAVGYYLLYEWLHTLHHWPPESWIGRLPLVPLLRRHHWRHHDPRQMAKGNFNVSFPLWDLILGTTLPDPEGTSP